jgi:hypothetical protein
MNDGGIAETCDEHLWKIQTRERRSHKKSGEIKQLSEVMDCLFTEDGSANAYIDIAKAIDFPKNKHIIHPYLLGVLLGDGGMTTTVAHIINPDNEIIERVKMLLPFGTELHKINYKEGMCDTYSIVSTNRKGKNIVTEELKRLGLLFKKSTEKHIPQEYLFDSISNRVDLLHGLNDTDGTANGNDFEYSTSSLELSKDYTELVRGLGFVTSVSSRIPKYKNSEGIKVDGQVSYRIRVNYGATFKPFNFKRKLARYSNPIKYLGYRYIANVDYIGDMTTKCISVTNPEHLYITDDYIVTHNTFISKEVAGLLDYHVITMNCNQFTSPLDILGGQTITGYQEGKLIQAWSNILVSPDGTKTPLDGVVLILDELPKIDPNTAGILNDALSAIKEYGYNVKTGIKDLPPSISNGRNEVFELGNLFVIATGNVALNTIDPDYEANFKQDLSLQDRLSALPTKCSWIMKMSSPKL